MTYCARKNYLIIEGLLWMVCTRATTINNVSWVISNMTAMWKEFHKALIFYSFEGIWNNYVDIQQEKHAG